jgi:hypothetical protein
MGLLDVPEITDDNIQQDKENGELHGVEYKGEARQGIFQYCIIYVGVSRYMIIWIA